MDGNLTLQRYLVSWLQIMLLAQGASSRIPGFVTAAFVQCEEVDIFCLSSFMFMV